MKLKTILFERWTNIFEMVTFPLCIWALTTSQDNGDLKSSLLSLTILLTYIVLMTRLDKTKVGGYAKVIGRIAKESINPFIVILILLCGFLLAFRNRSVYKDQYKASSFDTIKSFNVSFENSFFKIYSFMVGNIEASDMGLDNLTGPNLVTFGIFVVFLFLIPSLAFNIFTGIAINEIQTLMKVDIFSLAYITFSSIEQRCVIAYFFFKFNYQIHYRIF